MGLIQNDSAVDCVVSLTSWKGRIKQEEVVKSLYSIIRQKTKYRYKIYLTLSIVEFPNKEKDIPNNIKLLADKKFINIIWAEDNLKALKKMFPISTFINVPILTTDDDIILSNGAVEYFMNIHKAKPHHILTEYGYSFSKKSEVITGRFRLFPKNALLDVPTSLFKKCFNACEDDAYMAVLAYLRGTETIILNTDFAKEQSSKELDKGALRYEYWNTDKFLCRSKLIEELNKLYHKQYS